MPVALVDKPFEQRRDVAWLDLAGAGRPRGDRRRTRRAASRPPSGRSSPRWPSPTLRARCRSTASTSAAARSAPLRELPHVGGVAGRLETARGPPHGRRDRHPAGRPGAPVRRARHRLDGDVPAAAPPVRPRRHRWPCPRTGSATSSWSSTAGPRCATSTRISRRVLVDVATRGLSYGIHLVPPRPGGSTSGTTSRTCSAPGWSYAWATRPTRSSTGASRRTCRRPPPGRGLVADGLHMLTALPQATGRTPAVAGQADRGRLDRTAGAGRCACCPPLLPYAALLAPTESGEPAPGRTGARRCRSASPRPTCARCCIDFASRAAPGRVRRQRVRQVHPAAQPGRVDHATVHPGAGADRARRLPAQPAGRGDHRAPHRVRHGGRERRPR